MKRIVFILFGLAMIAVAGRSYGYFFTDGSASMNFTTLSPVARLQAIGNSAINSSGLEALYGNPATSLFSPYIDLSVNSAYFFDMVYGSVNFIYPELAVKSRIVLGASLFYFNSGQITLMDGNGDFIDNFSQNNFMFTGLLGFKISDQFTLGMNIKYAYQHLYIYGQHAFMADVGLAYIAPDSSGFKRIRVPAWVRAITPDRMGLVFRNLGISTTFNDLSEVTPMELTAGVMYYFFNDTLSLNIDFDMPFDSYGSFLFGLEYTLLYNYSFRLGYELPLRADGQLWYSRFVTGFGITINRYTLDYTIEPFNVLGMQHYLTLTYRLSL